MTSKSPSIKLGVLNMTISFDQVKTQRKFDKRYETYLTKMHPVPCFVPRTRTTNRRQLFADKNQETLNPYQKYRKSHRTSLQYYREHNQSNNTSVHLSGIQPQHHYQTMEVNQFKRYNENQNQNEEPLRASSRPIKGTQLKFTINKNHLREYPLQGQGKSRELFFFNPCSNPQQALKNIFTVRPVKTSHRYKRQTNDKKVFSRSPQTKQQNRSKNYRGILHEQKVIRPWSPVRNKDNQLIDSEMMQSNYPQ